LVVQAPEVKTEAVKSEVKVEATSATPEAIKAQVEFYFSDSNFPRDRFLRTEASKDPNGCKFLHELLIFISDELFRRCFACDRCVHSHEEAIH
jgi:hypothetical protein